MNTSLPIVRPESYHPSLPTTDEDYTFALQTAINVAANTGAIVLLSDRVYKISRTLSLYSSTIIVGTNPASRRSEDDYVGSVILYTGSSGAALKMSYINQKTSFLQETLRFRLQNFSIRGVDSYNECNTAIGLQFDSDATSLSPRHGIIENIYITGFNIGLNIEAGSYLTFRDLQVDNFKTTGIRISMEPISSTTEAEKRLIEFIYFDKVNMNNWTIGESENIKFGHLNTTGISIESGNNIYFSGIDINDCEYGFKFYNNTDLFAIFLQYINICRCIKCLYFEAYKEYMTRISVQDATLDHETWNRLKYDNTIKYAAIWFEQKVIAGNKQYTLGQCSFERIFDSMNYGDNHYFLYANPEQNAVNPEKQCYFSLLRVGNPVHINCMPRRFEAMNIENKGIVTITHQNTIGTQTIASVKLFPDNIMPYVKVKPIDSNISAVGQIYYEVEDGKMKTKVKVIINSSYSNDLHFYYYIPDLS